MSEPVQLRVVLKSGHSYLLSKGRISDLRDNLHAGIARQGPTTTNQFGTWDDAILNWSEVAAIHPESWTAPVVASKEPPK